MEKIEERKQLKFLSQIHGDKCWPSVDKLSPCEEACPIHTDVPSYVIAISQGRFKEALEVLRETNPFPSVCGRVCHHPCETDCNRALLDEPIAISSLKRFAAEYGMANGQKVAPVPKTKKEKVAIIGSGPAGLSAAYDLIRQGYGVTVYEAAPFAGGMLALGIPSFILPREIIRAEIGMIKALGVEIKTNVPIGKVVSLEELRKVGFKAILLATGAHKSSPLPIPGADLSSVHYALPLLKKANLGEKISFRGKVVVIGGGAVAMDAARTAKRLGAQEVHVACLEARKDMPAWAWLVEAAEKEGVKVHTQLAPQRFTAQAREDGKPGVRIEFQRVASTRVDEEGRISWTLMEGPASKYGMEADSVIVAIGQAPDASYAEKTGVKITGRGTFMVNGETLGTNLPGVFAAGDAVSLRGTVIEAIAAGQKVARSIHRYFQGQDLSAPAPGKEILKIDPELTAPWLIRKSRWGMPSLPSRDAIRTFDEVELGYTRAVAIEEAKRCLNCRMCVNCLYGRSQICFETGQRLL